MKVTVPEISFHNRDPILSVDIQLNAPDGIIRMATAGTDTHVVVWQLNHSESGSIDLEAISDLARHNRAVNAVRFSPDGEHIASADDEAAIIVWKKNSTGSNAPDLFSDEGETKNKEHWSIHKMLRGHIEDVYDLCWSSCSNFLVSGSIDNCAIMWDVHKGKNIGLLKDHKNFVQGVAWDPQGQYVVTLSHDRVLRWFSTTTKRVLHKAYKASLPTVAEDGTVKEFNGRLFYDDTLKSFCRRLCFSPDGNLLAVPSGIVEAEEGRPGNAVHLFTRLSPTKPVLYLPTRDKFTVAVRFCPLLFKLRGEEKPSVFALPYRMVVAVACQNSVVLYDTQQLLPFGRMSNLHYARLTDLAWSGNGRILAITSTDGYCSFVTFEEGELGEVYSAHEKSNGVQKIDASDNKSETISSPKTKMVNSAKISNLNNNKVLKDDLNVEKNSAAVECKKEEESLDSKSSVPCIESTPIVASSQDTKQEQTKAEPIAVKRIEPKPIAVKRIALKPAPLQSNKNVKNISKSESSDVESKNCNNKENIVIGGGDILANDSEIINNKEGKVKSVNDVINLDSDSDMGSMESGDESEDMEDEEDSTEEMEAGPSGSQDENDEAVDMNDDSCSLGSHDSAEDDDSDASDMSFCEDDEDKVNKVASSTKFGKGGLPIVEPKSKNKSSENILKSKKNQCEVLTEIKDKVEPMVTKEEVKPKPIPMQIKSTKSARRVQLISLPREGAPSKAPPSPAPFQKSPSVQEVNMDLIVENTSDLCLKFEGENTVTSPIKTKGPPTPKKSTASLSKKDATKEKETTKESETGKVSGERVTPLKSDKKTPRRVAFITLASPKPATGSPKAKKALIPSSTTANSK